MEVQIQIHKDPPCPAATGDRFGPPPEPPKAPIPEPPIEEGDTEPAPAAAVITDEMKADLESYRLIYRVPGSTVIYLELPPFLAGW